MSDSEIFEITVPVSDDLPRDWTQAGGEQRLHELLEAAGHPRRRGAIRLLQGALDLLDKGRASMASAHRAPIHAQSPLRAGLPTAQAAGVAGAGDRSQGLAGTFAALELVEAGLSPIVIDRGEAVRPRRKALADLKRARSGSRTATTALEKAPLAPSATASCTRGSKTKRVSGASSRC